MHQPDFLKNNNLKETERSVSGRKLLPGTENKMKQRTAVLLLSALLVSAFAASCGDSTANTPAETQKLSDETVVETEAVSTRPNHQVPVDSLDFGGETYRNLTFKWQGYTYYFFAEEENGDVMNDAVYHRQCKVEDALNVKIETVFLDNYDPQVAEIKKTVQAGDDVYQAAYLHCIGGVSALSSGGFLYNLDTLPYIDMNAEWWNKTQMDLLRLGQNTYYAINDFMIPCPYVIFFNKEMVANMDMENPYQLVYDGKWTLDAFTSMAKQAVADVNGDGKMDINDQYGVMANEISKYISFVTGANQYITKRDADNRVELAMNTDKMVSLVETFADLMKQNVIFVPASMSDQTTWVPIDSGRMLFELNAITEAEKMRDYRVEFGFLPYPKYDEAQEDYISLDWGGLCCVPTTIANPEKAGAVMELLAYESKNEVIPTYYDTILTGKLARDNDAVKMMDILFDTITYEIGGNYFGFDAGVSDMFYALPRITVVNKSADFASWYKKNEKGSIKTIEKFYENLDKVESAE